MVLKSRYTKVPDGRKVSKTLLDLLSGDLNYDNIAAVKQILKKIVGE